MFLGSAPLSSSFSILLSEICCGAPVYSFAPNAGSSAVSRLVQLKRALLPDNA